MDAVNRFDTRATHALMRLEQAIALGVCLTLFALHLDQVRWLPAVLLFAAIDVVGYLPGALAHRRAGSGRVPRPFYVLYNVTHSFATHAVVVAVWVLVAGWEWALLAIPIHLCGDRALFGNTLKPFAVPFEPEPHPAWVRLSEEVEGTASPAPAPRLATS